MGCPSQEGRWWLGLGLWLLLLLLLGFGGVVVVGDEGGGRPDGGGGGGGWGPVGLMAESRNLVGLRRPRRMRVMEGIR